MNREAVLVFTIALMAAFSPGCKDNGVSVDSRAIGLYAKVIDASGNALTGVNVHYIFYTESNPVVLNVSLQYGLPTSQVVTLKVLDPFGREVSTLINGQQQAAGVYTILFDSAVTNGVYSFRLQANDSIQTTAFFIRDDDLVRLQQKPPLTVSDQGGQFFLSPSVLGIGRKFRGQFSTDTIADSISIILVKANYRMLVQTFRLDMTKPTDRTFTLEAN
jgi:hypothetical protein